jgi:hypothetical protein
VTRTAAARTTAALALALMGVTAGYVSYRLNTFGLVSGGVPLGLVFALLGAAAGLFLIGVAGWMLWRRRNFMALNEHITLAATIAAVYILIEGAVYIAMVVIATLAANAAQ